MNTKEVHEHFDGADDDGAPSSEETSALDRLKQETEM